MLRELLNKALTTINPYANVENIMAGYNAVMNSPNPVETYLKGAKDYVMQGYDKFNEQITDIDNRVSQGDYMALSEHPVVNAMGGVAGMMVGPKAKDFAKMTQFSNMGDKMPRAEISDAGAELLTTNITSYEQKLPEIFAHKELYENYPFLKKTNIFGVPNSELRGTGSYHPATNGYGEQTGYILVGENAVSKPTLLHEIQHAIQEKEGWAKGGSPAMIGESELGKTWYQNKAKSLLAELENTPVDYFGKRDRIKNELYKLRQKSEHEGYLSLAGEIESRATADRMNLTPAQRLSSDPYAGQGIPLKDWIVNMKGSPIQELINQAVKR